MKYTWTPFKALVKAGFKKWHLLTKCINSPCIFMSEHVNLTDTNCPFLLQMQLRESELESILPPALSEMNPYQEHPA